MKLKVVMDITTLKNSTVLLKFAECVYKVKFQYPVKRKSIKTERYSEQCANSQICYLLNELFSKVRDGKIVSKIETEYFNVHVKRQEWHLGLKMQLKPERQSLHCYPEVFLLVVELKDFLIKKDMLHQPMPLNCSNLNMSQNKTKIFKKPMVGNNDKEKADVIFSNSISRESSPHVPKVNTSRMFILATPKPITVDKIGSKSLKKRCNISDVLNKHDNVVKSISTPITVTPKRQCYKLTVDHFFSNENKKMSNSEQVARSSKHCEEEKTHLISREIYKSFMNRKTSPLYPVNGTSHQHKIIKPYSEYNPSNNQTSEKKSRQRKGSQIAESNNMSVISNSVSKIDVLGRQKPCTSSGQNENKNVTNYLPINKRKRQEVTNGLIELNNSHDCKSGKKHTFKKVPTADISNISELCSSVESTSDSCLHKENGDEMENIEQNLVLVNPISQHCPHTKRPHQLETVRVQNELINKKLQQNIYYPGKQLKAQQFVHHQPKDKIYKPQSTYVLSPPIQHVGGALPQSYNLKDMEIYDKNNCCMEIDNQLPEKLYKDDVCLLRSPQIKLVKISRKRTFDLKFHMAKSF